MISWIAAICVLLSVWFYGRDSRLGPVFGIVASALWVYYAVEHHDLAILLMNGVLGILHVCAKQNWRN